MQGVVFQLHISLAESVSDIRLNINRNVISKAAIVAAQNRSGAIAILVQTPVL